MPSEETSLSQPPNRGAVPICPIPAVDSNDWLKVAAILSVSIDHFGYFFIEDDLWWSTFGRIAAPIFFFLLGCAQTRAVPLRWIGLGVVLTLLESWNEDWTWVAANILISLAVVRMLRPYAQILVRNQGWAGFLLLVCGLLAVIPLTSKVLDYGSEGWLWALCGLCQRMYADRARIVTARGAISNLVRGVPTGLVRVGLMRLLACAIAALVYVWREQAEYSFPRLQLTAFILEAGVLSATLCLFHRGASRFQPPAAVVGLLRFIGRHTLEIYAIQLAGSELLVRLLPNITR